MLIYRAVRKPDQDNWQIEIFDTEFQVAYFNEITSFKTKRTAEQFIVDACLVGVTYVDKGDVGEWINGIGNGTL